MPKYTGAKIDLMRDRGFILVTEAAELTGEAKGSLYPWIRQGKIASEKVGTATFVSIDGLLSYLGPAYADKLAPARTKQKRSVKAK